MNENTMGTTVNVAILADLVTQLRTAGNWCGETHVQKTIYLLQTARQVPMGYSFVLYKPAPYSFDLEFGYSEAPGTPHVEAGAITSAIRTTTEYYYAHDKICRSPTRSD